MGLHIDFDRSTKSPTPAVSVIPAVQHSTMATPVAHVVQQIAPDERLAAYTYDLVVATFVLALITMLAIVIPLVASAISNQVRRNSSLREIDAVLALIGARLEALINNFHSVEGTAIDLLVARAFSLSVAQSLGANSIGNVYRAVAQAADVIIAIKAFAAKPPVRARGGSDDIAVRETLNAFVDMQDRQKQEERLIAAAAIALKSVNEARTSLNRN